MTSRLGVSIGPVARAAVLAAGAGFASAAWAQAHFQPEEIDKGREQYHRTCAQCHGRNMVNSGTTVYDLRRFPVDDVERFQSSVTNGKGNMPSFKDALTPQQIELLWAYVGSRGGKEP
jgi:mono/diheme cytochrome c family protein